MGELVVWRRTIYSHLKRTLSFLYAVAFTVRPHDARRAHARHEVSLYAVERRHQRVA